MRYNSILLVVAIMLLLPGTTSAQVGRLLKKKLQEATQTAVDKKAEEKSNEATENALMGLLGGGEAVYDQSYNFDGRIIMEMTAYGKEGEEDSVIDYLSYINQENGNVGVELRPISGEATKSSAAIQMIFDQKNKSAIVMTREGDQATAIITSTEIDEELIEEEEFDKDPLSDYKKTGKTKTIEGYKCEEYVFSDEESTTHVWITRDFDYKLKNKHMTKMGIPSWYGGPDGMGMMMEMESYDEGRMTMKLIVKEIDMSFSKSLSLDGYMIMNIGEK